jgi:hypothetical protein
MRFGGIAIVLALVLVLIFGSINPRTLDETDDHETGKRSGMNVLIDHGTNCQYLKASGGLTPRLDVSGKPMCGVSE